MDKNPKHPLKKKQAKDKQKKKHVYEQQIYQVPHRCNSVGGELFCFGILDCNGVGIDKDLPFM